MQRKRLARDISSKAIGTAFVLYALYPLLFQFTSTTVEWLALHAIFLCVCIRPILSRRFPFRLALCFRAPPFGVPRRILSVKAQRYPDSTAERATMLQLLSRSYNTPVHVRSLPKVTSTRIRFLAIQQRPQGTSKDQKFQKGDVKGSPLPNTDLQLQRRCKCSAAQLRNELLCRFLLANTAHDASKHCDNSLLPQDEAAASHIMQTFRLKVRLKRANCTAEAYATTLPLLLSNTPDDGATWMLRVAFAPACPHFAVHIGCDILAFIAEFLRSVFLLLLK